jgi:hypothetical protein
MRDVKVVVAGAVRFGPAEAPYEVPAAFEFAVRK